MLTTPHVLTALAILKIVPNPIIAIVLAFFSHFILDWFIPHWNPHLFTEHKKAGKISKNSLLIIISDGSLTLLILGFLTFSAWPDIKQIIIYSCVAIASTLPDLIEIPYYFLGSKNGFLKKYVAFEHKNQANGTVFWGIITQVLIILACFKQIFF